MRWRKECRGFANNGCGDEAPARGMSRLEYPPHINIDAAEALA
jgi:hypothetical protein